MQKQFGSKNIFKNYQGFLTIHTLMLIPILMTLTFGLSWFLSLMMMKQKIYKVCFNEPMISQKKANEYIDQLLILNPVANQLRFRQKALEIELIAAIAGLPETTGLVIKLKHEIQAIFEQRVQIDRRQKQILNLGKILLTQTKFQTLEALNSSFRNLSSNWLWIHWKANVWSKAKARLAVRPLNPDIAPSYELDQPFERNQSLDFSLQIEVSLAEPFNQWIHQKFEVNEVCSTTIDSQKSPRQILIKKGKF